MGPEDDIWNDNLVAEIIASIASPAAYSEIFELRRAEALEAAELDEYYLLYISSGEEYNFKNVVSNAITNSATFEGTLSIVDDKISDLIYCLKTLSEN